jgi:hypothetical protein
MRRATKAAAAAAITGWALAGLVALVAEEAAAIDVTAMYRGSCQVDTGVILRVDNKAVAFLGLDGVVKKIPRYEIVGMASYPLPDLPVSHARVPPDLGVDFYEFQTFRNEELIPLAVGWPIEYNAENVQILTRDGRDHLVARNDIWGVHKVEAPREVTFTANQGAADAVRYRLRHPLAFERCPDNIVGQGTGEPVPVIPQTTYDSPIAIKRQHDHLRDGLRKVEDYADRQRFYAIPQYYVNRTLLGTWGLIGSRYSDVGARQVNFLPLVQNEYSEGPFGFQRVVRSGVAPLAWGLHEEPTVQVFYGLKADYVRLEAFFDPTAPLIGKQYDYSKGQLNALDDRLVEKGGLEFGFDFGYAAIVIATTGGNMAIRDHDYFTSDSFESTRVGVSFQYNYLRAGAYVGTNAVELDKHLEHDFRFLEVYGQGHLGPRLRMRTQLIQRQLVDAHAQDAPIKYDSTSRTIAVQTDWDVNYRWTIYGLGSAERQTAEAVRITDGESDSVSKLYPKLAGGVTVAF